jgi:hypothetical protein
VFSSLGGELPVFVYLPYLLDFVISDNGFSGCFPRWYLPLLRTFDVGQNRFSCGLLGDWGTQLQELRLLDLSENPLQGTIPLNLWEMLPNVKSLDAR